jgi:hypothetical protein
MKVNSPSFLKLKLCCSTKPTKHQSGGGRSTLDKVSKLFLGMIAVVFFTGCVNSVGKIEPFKQFAGTTQTIQREALLYRLPAESEHQRGVFYDLYAKKEGSNAWRKEGWLPVGTKVQILEINRYRTDARGAWIGVVGLVEDPSTHDKVKFLYCWSYFHWLNRAPWENEATPERRETSVLH